MDGVLRATEYGTDGQNDSKEHLSFLCSSAGGRGTTERFRRNWADINHHSCCLAVLSPSCRSGNFPRLYPVFSCSRCQCCMYIITISVLYYSVLYYPVMSFLMWCQLWWCLLCTSSLLTVFCSAIPILHSFHRLLKTPQTTM